MPDVVAQCHHSDSYLSSFFHPNNFKHPFRQKAASLFSRYIYEPYLHQPLRRRRKW
jgi:hypothetical protein